MIDTAEIRRLAEKYLEDSDLYVVDVKCSASDEVEVTLDGQRSVGIEDCVKLSRAIEAELESGEHNFQLTVGSAGIGQPLRDERQYRKLIGHKVDVVLRSGAKLTGTLTAFDGQSLTIAYKDRVKSDTGNRKTTVELTAAFPLSDIKITKEHIDFQ